MSTPVVSVVAGEDVDFDAIATRELLGLFTAIEQAKAALDRLQLAAGEAIVARGTDIQAVRAAMKIAKVRDARRRVAVIEALPALPCAYTAFRAGAIGVDHLVPLARLSKRLPEHFAAAEADLAAQARLRTPHGVKALVAEFVLRHEPQPKLEDDPEVGVRFVSRDDGCVELYGVLDPLTGAVLQKTLNDLADALWREQHPERNKTRADRPEHPITMIHALRALCDRPHSTARRALRRSRYLLHVLIDYQTLLHGLHQRSIAITAADQPLPVETVRKLACDAELLPVVLNGDAMPIDMGRAKRWFTNAQHVAALSMFQTCAMCDVPAEQCALHHINDWQHGGTTDLANACALCVSCHDTVHRDHLHIEQTNGIVTVRRPDGTIHTQRARNTSPRDLKLTA